MLPRFPIPSALRVSLALLLASASAARAAELVLANGDRLTGKVVKIAGGTITFHSDILGNVVVSQDKAKIVEPPPPPVPSNSLAGLPPPPKAAAGSGPTPAEWWWPAWLSRRILVLEPAVSQWTGKLEFGYVNTLNTTRVDSTTVRADAERNVGPDDLLFKGLYLDASSGGQLTTDQYLLTFQWRHNLSQRVFTQMLTSYSADKVRLINDDVEQTVDLGYKLYTTKVQTVDVGLGAMAQYLDATGVEQGADYLGNAFQDYTYKINGRYTFLENASIQYSPERRAVFGTISNLPSPSGSSAQNYDYTFGATLQGKISEHLSLNLHFDYEYNNAILVPDARADQQISTTLGYAF